MSADEGTPVSRIAVIGAGTMGAQIATLAAYSGFEVTLFDALPAAVDGARARITSTILPSIATAAHLAGDADGTLARLSFPADLAATLEGADLVIEAVKEELEIKRELFAELSRLAPGAVLATNSSSIPSAQIADVVDRPDRVLNMHFFAPIWVRSMLEIMSCGSSSDDARAAAAYAGKRMSLVVATVRGQSKGFIFNRIWRAVKRESLRVVDEGVADPEDVDRLWMLFFQTQYAPFGIMDMVGLDVVRDIEWSYQRETLDPTDVPSQTLLRMIEAGTLGEKSGQGFYSHPDPAYRRADFLSGTNDE